MLSWRLQTRFRTLMPSCIVIPFGAPFSGHGTVSSDCDLCVLTKPDSLDVAMFAGPAYLPPDLLAYWENLQATPPPATSCQGEPHVHHHSSRYSTSSQGENKPVSWRLGLIVCWQWCVRTSTVLMFSPYATPTAPSSASFMSHISCTVTFQSITGTGHVCVTGL